MRWAMVVIALAAVGAALVHFRRDEVRHRHEIRRLARQQVRLRRSLWDQQVQLSELTSPKRVRGFVTTGSLDLVDRTDPDAPLGEASTLASRVPR